ncbi:MAG: FtsX-like permease family protein [Ekhidna sp.]|uniref:ABC transporter permease n=1 Tax=Ekhidna sp. TaxID=2608089 RepID=UPI0032EEDE30
MLKNFFLISFRNLKKNGLYSIINISGLSIGIVCSVLILLWVADEVSYDKFLPKYDRLYQVWISSDFDNRVNNWRSVPLPTYEEMKVIDSNIKNSVVTGWGGTRLLTVGDTRILKDGYYVSEEFLEMFEFELISGSHAEALKDPMSIVLSESTAKILFGDEDPIGKQVRLEDEGTLQVTAIVKDVPKNSSFEFDYLATWKYRESVNQWVKDNRTNWGNYSFQVFVELNDASRELDVEENIADLIMEKDSHDNMKKHFFLHPMKKWRLYSNWNDQGEEAGGRSDYVQLFTVIAIVILIIACINFMNLATARSEKRAKEVGIRKSLGSSRGKLISQFMGESIFITALAFILAVLLTELSLPAYNNLVEKNLFIDYSSPIFWLASVGIIVVVGVIAGSYPAFYLSSFRPVQTLKGTVKAGKGATTPRKVLVVLQFGFSIVLMISTIVIFQQIDLVKNRDLGYEQENLISVELTNDLTENYDVVKQQLLQSGLVESVTRSNSQITSINSNNFLGWPGKPEDQRVIFTTITSEYDYAKTMGIDVLMGRDFSKEFASDSDAIVINKAALDLMGLENPIGTNLDLWSEKRKLIGVVDDVLMGSPYEPVKPMFVILANWGGYISVRLKKTDDLQATLKGIQPIFEEHNPAYPFEYKFADVEFQRKFTTINLTRKLATIFAALAMVITGLGLFGLASYMAEQRIKEIGIRKVLGATIANLMGLMSKDFAKLVLVSFFIAAPLSWYLLDKYLDRYTIRVDIAWWVFPMVGTIVLGFAIAIVSDQARRAAKANPVKSLRNE